MNYPNYPNMSYCAFENTAAAIDQLISIVDDALNNRVTREEFITNLSSQHEEQAFKRLYSQLEVLRDLIDELR